MNGTIKKIVADKGFGFIKVDGQEKDVFFHSKSCANFNDLHEGDTVSFEIDDSGPKGPAAVNVNKA